MLQTCCSHGWNWMLSGETYPRKLAWDAVIVSIAISLLTLQGWQVCSFPLKGFINAGIYRHLGTPRKYVKGTAYSPLDTKKWWIPFWVLAWGDLGAESWYCSKLILWLWVRRSTSPSLCCLVCKTGIMISLHRAILRFKWAMYAETLAQIKKWLAAEWSSVIWQIPKWFAFWPLNFCLRMVCEGRACRLRNLGFQMDVSLNLGP